MKDKRQYNKLKEHGEDISLENEVKIIADDRGSLDLTKQIDTLKQDIERLEFWNSQMRNEIQFWKNKSSELEIAQNLLHGYKNVIERLTAKLRQKDS
jgi:hypothetical protein|tara:strand:- start:84 stop:374 length:291 start_codon:yes stop_codon:yes gene_type:complete